MDGVSEQHQDWWHSIISSSVGTVDLGQHAQLSFCSQHGWSVYVATHIDLPVPVDTCVVSSTDLAAAFKVAPNQLLVRYICEKGHSFADL